MSTIAPRGSVDRKVRWGLNDATVGIALAVLLVWAVGWAATRGWPAVPELRTALSYFAAWVPLLGAVFFASYVRGRRSLVRDFGLRFAWIDLFFGLVVGGMMRAAATLVEIVVYGRVATGGPTFGPVVHDVWWVLLALLAPVIAAPLIEELFFRGLLQRSLVRASLATASPTLRASRIPVVVAILVTAVIFAAVHMLQTSGGLEMIVVGISTLIVGVGTGVLAATTGRLGAGIIAHVTYNGLVIAWSLL
ncbi:membrane protease YdiL (CAAX protease family) [Okibacterium sp. HSC-33S16]|uniref:CPBP family intramembrane glutamic endopeptidase n=1 Tax=Okibacterium sp. HSC-33S16 TaxID=2910965 RepID=UPI00209FA6C5|nr:CPBP family intramembrane glutamic endopeptidase [Okibacterium sp. HSC-33S16]MCP2032104.1 membrane protease YdiL (CAAX protease family) [Okibacterium sp. HSC-33S16]